MSSPRMVPLLCVCGVVLIGAVVSSPSCFLRFALGVDSSRLVIANTTSRWCWLPMGLLCEIAYLRELFPLTGDIFSSSMPRSSPLVTMPLLLRGL